MANADSPDERVVYLALKDVFKGSNSAIRQPKAIRKLIKSSKGHRDVATLLQAYNIDTICKLARTLLADQVFESTLKAKIRFPDLFDVSPTQSAERQASEAQAARKDANAIRGVVPSCEEDLDKAIQLEAALQNASVNNGREPQVSKTNRTQQAPSLFPVYLPFKTQHALLVKVQATLEKACFAFAQRFMPEVLEVYRWDCPESVELNLWTKVFQENQREFFGDIKSTVGKPLRKLLCTVEDIRHTAVHRIRVSARGVEQFLLDAECFAAILEDEECLQSVKKMRQNTQSVIGELERNKHVLSSKLEDTLKKIAAQRAALDRMEEEAISEMVREDVEYQMFAGTNLEQAVASVGVTEDLLAPSEEDASSDTDDMIA